MAALGLAAYAPLEFRAPAAAFVGRRRELDELAEALARSGREQAARLVCVVGPPGIGKSRLANEAVAAMADGATVVTGHCLSYGEGIAYGPLADIVRRLTATTRSAASRASSPPRSRRG